MVTAGWIRIDAHADRITAQADDRQLGQTEGFGLGNIRSAVQVQQVAGSAVRLVARLESFFMRPLHPCVHVVEMQLRQRAPVVALDARQRVVVERMLAAECRRVRLDVVAVHLLEHLRQRGVQLAL